MRFLTSAGGGDLDTTHRLEPTTPRCFTGLDLDKLGRYRDLLTWTLGFNWNQEWPGDSTPSGMARRFDSANYARNIEPYILLGLPLYTLPGSVPEQNYQTDLDW